MDAPYQRAMATMASVPRNISALVSSKIVQPIMNRPTLAMMADTKIKCCVKLLARQPKPWTAGTRRLVCPGRIQVPYTGNEAILYSSSSTDQNDRESNPSRCHHLHRLQAC
jgi:hypothetical protein